MLPKKMGRNNFIKNTPQTINLNLESASIRKAFVVLVWTLKEIKKALPWPLFIFYILRKFGKSLFRLINWFLVAYAINILVLLVKTGNLTGYMSQVILISFLFVITRFLDKLISGKLGFLLEDMFISVNMRQLWDFKFFKNITLLDYANIQKSDIQNLIKEVSDQGSFRQVQAFHREIAYILSGFVITLTGFIMLLKYFPIIIAIIFLFLIFSIISAKFSSRYWLTYFKSTRDFKKFSGRLKSNLSLLDTLIRLKEIFIDKYLMLIVDKLIKFEIDTFKAGTLLALKYELVPTILDITASGLLFYLSAQKIALGLMSIGTFSVIRSAVISSFGIMTGVFESIERSITRSIPYLWQTYKLNLFIESLEQNNKKLNDKVISKAILLYTQENKPIIVTRDLAFSYYFLNNVNNLSSVKNKTNSWHLHDINLKIEQGANIAIVGENGAGKSTFIKLLTGLYKPNNGSIKILGLEPYLIDAKDKLRIFSIVNQQFLPISFLNVYNFITLDKLAIAKRLFLRLNKNYTKVLIKDIINGNNQDLLEKVVYSQAKNDKRFWKVLDLVGLKNKVLSLPLKENTYLSPTFKNGVDLSTGQWQRLFIAKSLYTLRPIHIYDEPTSAIDPIAGFSIVDNIYKELKDKTVLLVSHRYSLVKNADLILVFKDGKIIEQGRHKKLMQLRGYYYKAYEIEARKYKL